jgi:hypothetical protein
MLVFFVVVYLGILKSFHIVSTAYSRIDATDNPFRCPHYEIGGMSLIIRVPFEKVLLRPMRECYVLLFHDWLAYIGLGAPCR